jgi:hypothetical protein
VREIYGNAFHAVYDQFVLERIRNECGDQTLGPYDAAAAIMPAVIQGLPTDLLVDCPLVLLYLLRDKRPMTGAFFDKTIGLRAFCSEQVVWIGPQVCLVCDWHVNTEFESFYTLNNKELKPSNLFDVRRINVPRASRWTRDFGGLVEPGFTTDRAGFTICVNCVNMLMAHDPHELSLLVTLLGKADKAHVKVLEKAAIESLSWRERWAIQEEKRQAARKKKQLIRGVEVAAKYVVDDSGNFVEVE